MNRGRDLLAELWKHRVSDLQPRALPTDSTSGTCLYGISSKPFNEFLEEFTQLRLDITRITDMFEKFSSIARNDLKRVLVIWDEIDDGNSAHWDEFLQLRANAARLADLVYDKDSHMLVQSVLDRLQRIYTKLQRDHMYVVLNEGMIDSLGLETAMDQKTAITCELNARIFHFICIVDRFLAAMVVYDDAQRETCLLLKYCPCESHDKADDGDGIFAAGPVDYGADAEIMERLTRGSVILDSLRIILSRLACLSELCDFEMFDRIEFAESHTVFPIMRWLSYRDRRYITFVETARMTYFAADSRTSTSLDVVIVLKKRDD